MITIDDITLPVITSTICKNASTLRMQKLNNSSAKEQISTQCANKCATWMLDTIKSLHVEILFLFFWTGAGAITSPLFAGFVGASGGRVIFL
jgi:hypothetical protein